MNLIPMGCDTQQSDVLW